MRLRMNLATALEASGDPKAALAELNTARLALRRRSNVDREALVNLLSNAASIASTHQLWSRDKIEKSYLTALALDPLNVNVQQNLLLFKKQGEQALKMATSGSRKGKKKIQESTSDSSQKVFLSHPRQRLRICHCFN